MFSCFNFRFKFSSQRGCGGLRGGGPNTVRIFILGYLLAQGWNWAQRTLGKWAHYTLDTGK